MTTASPRASRAPLSSRWRRMTIVIEEQGVGTQALADGLDRDHVLGGDVAQVHVRAEVLDEPDLLRLARRLEDDAGGVDLHLDLVDQACFDLARRVVDADGSRLASLYDHLPSARGELALDLIDPTTRRHDLGASLAADRGKDREVFSRALVVAQFLRERVLNAPTGAPDDLEPVVRQDRDFLLQLLGVTGELEEPPATAHVD